jgi:CspA family cold shock protein
MNYVPPQDRQTGKVKFFDKDRGFGFISPNDGGRDVFVHVSSVQRSGLPHLEEGMAISFAVESDARGRGPQAINLQLL